MGLSWKLGFFIASVDLRLRFRLIPEECEKQNLGFFNWGLGFIVLGPEVLFTLSPSIVY